MKGKHNMMHNALKLSVLTFNAWGLKLGVFPIACSVDERIRRIAEEVNRLHPDVAAFQEVWTEKSARRLMNSLDYGYYSYHPGRKMLKGALGNGLLFFSRYPIVEEHMHTFTRYTEWYEYFAAKGVLMIRIETPHGFIQLFNTHLGSGKLPVHIQNRQKQLHELQRYISLFSRRYPSMLAGDLNIDPDMREYGQLTGWMLDTFNDSSQDTYGSLHPASKGHTFFKNRSYKRPSSRHDQDERIDYIFILRSKENRSHVDLIHSEVVLNHPENPLSDHCGLLTTFEITRKKTLPDMMHSGTMEYEKSEYH